MKIKYDLVQFHDKYAIRKTYCICNFTLRTRYIRLIRGCDSEIECKLDDVMFQYCLNPDYDAIKPIYDFITSLRVPKIIIEGA